ncbi:uncharacterized protein VTP21DRAFT_11535 [Calcarisporiella thermophila]|uniref:uncharacterized protein n=1 Tax=Calcarisporiella thermophila TaxID=911321 RepID=UPI0037432A9A
MDKFSLRFDDIFRFIVSECKFVSEKRADSNARQSFPLLGQIAGQNRRFSSPCMHVSAARSRAGTCLLFTASKPPLPSPSPLLRDSAATLSSSILGISLNLKTIIHGHLPSLPHRRECGIVTLRRHLPSILFIATPIYASIPRPMAGPGLISSNVTIRASSPPFLDRIQSPRLRYLLLPNYLIPLVLRGRRFDDIQAPCSLVGIGCSSNRSQLQACTPASVGPETLEHSSSEPPGG